uniref:F-box domain-containing protein n=1 Tax=Caenorhabditis tropicalis TaxID=1561998 RepID=A0A1I7TAI0_9PELO
MNSKPLTYDSLKTVIQYMDPNTRFLLYSRISSIRTVERAVPLVIERLSIQDHQVWVNNTCYECGIYQVDCENKIPYRVSGWNKFYFQRICNVDEFGTRDYITEAGGMLPGNNGRRYERNLFGYFDRENIPTNEGRLQKLEAIIEIEKQRLNQLMNYRPESSSANKEDERKNLDKFKFVHIEVPKIYNEDELKLLNNKKMVKEAIKYAKDRIKDMENELLPFENKRNNIRPKFEIHLVTFGYYGRFINRVNERVKYTGDLHKAEENLRDFMFSNRRHVVRVNSFETNQKCAVKMPQDLKMRIENLRLCANESPILEQVKSIIDESSFPLERLAIAFISNAPQNLDYKFIGNSKYLECYLMFAAELPIIRSLQNKIVYFSTCLTHFLKSEDFIVLIRNWIQTNKPTGTCFTFSLYKAEEEIAIKILDRVKRRIVNATSGDKWVKISMSSSAVLKIRYFQNASSTLFIRMVVVPVK